MPAFITVLSCLDTIDMSVQKRIELKKDLSDYVVDGAENEISDSLKQDMLDAIKSLY